MSKNRFLYFVIVISLFAVFVLTACDDRFRYLCQDPKNWATDPCKRPACAINGTCPDQLIKPEDMKGEK